MRDGGTSSPAPFLAAVLPLLAGPLTLGLLQLFLQAHGDGSVDDLSGLWNQGGRVVMSVAAGVAALAAVGGGVALFSVGRGKLLALAVLPALATVVLVPAVVGASHGWAEVESVLTTIPEWRRPLALASGALEVERALTVTLLFDAMLFFCWAAALLGLALDVRTTARPILVAVSLISGGLGGLVGAMARAELVRARAEALAAPTPEEELIDRLAPELAAWTAALADTRLAAGVFAGTLLAVVVLARSARARVGVAAWGLITLTGVAGARALTRAPTALVAQARAALAPADFLDFDGAADDASTASHVLGEVPREVNFLREPLRSASHRVLLEKNASAAGLWTLVERALVHDTKVELLGLQSVSLPGVEVPATMRALMQRCRSVRIELSANPVCPGPCATATLDAEGLLVKVGTALETERWPLEEHGPGFVERGKPLFLELAAWEPRWLIGAVHAAAKRGHRLVVTQHVVVRATLRNPPEVHGPLSVAEVLASVDRLECASLATGLLTVRALVSPSGAIGQTQVRSSTAEDAQLERCLLEQLRTWRFPRKRAPTLVDLDFSVSQEPP